MRTKFYRLLFIALLLTTLCVALPSYWISVTATNIVDAQGNPVTGTVYFLATDDMDRPLPGFRPGGGGQVIRSAVKCTVTDGTIIAPCQVPSSQYTTPLNVKYRIVVNTPAGTIYYKAVAIQAISGGNSWSLDDYLPTNPPTGFSSNDLTVAALHFLDGTVQTTAAFGDNTGGGTGGGSSYVDNTVPTGTVDGVNNVFTLPSAPSPTSSVVAQINGLILAPGVDFTVAGTTITFISSAQPRTGDVFLVSYRTSTVGNFADFEVPSGALNGVNAVFTMAHTPNPSSSLQIIRNGLLQIAGVDYTVAGATVTFISIPQTGDTLVANYRY